jgi:hypothetical protein
MLHVGATRTEEEGGEEEKEEVYFMVLRNEFG